MRMIRILSTFCMFLATAGYAQDDWTLQTPPVSPSVRAGHGMAYIGDDKVLLFGGGLDFNGTLSNETWVYDLSDNAWTNITPLRGSPSARYNHAMAYIGDDKVLMFGGIVNFLNGTVSNQTWIFDLSDNNWAPLLSLSGPSAREGHALAFIGDGQVVLNGGFDGISFSDETWVFNLSTFSWTLKNPTTIPSVRTSSIPLVYVGGDQVLLFAHSIDPINLSTSTTWLYDLSENEWQLKNELTIPYVSSGSGMASLTGSDWVLLFGGNTFGAPPNGTFVYDLSDNTWSLQSPSTLPADRQYHTMASIGAGKVLMFGGVSNGLNNETWVYTATLPVVTHTINATAGAGGTITPSGPVVVNHDGNQSFTITPDANYEIADVLVDGISVGSVASHTFNNVTADHTIAASFTAIQRTITATAGPNGSIDPSGAVVVNQSDNRTFTITPDANYQIADVLVDGSSVGSVASHTFSNVAADHTITASFSEIPNNTQTTPIGYWPFDGDGTDQSGGNRNLTLFGTPGFGTGLFGQAINVDGTGTMYAQRPSDDEIFDFGSNDFTISIWVKFSTIDGEQVLIEKFSGCCGPGWTLTKLSSQQLQFYANPLVVMNSAVLNPAVDVWHNATICRMGNDFKMFFDGQLILSHAESGPISNTADALLIGRRNFADGRVFPVNGLLDDAAIWSRCLTVTEIALLWNDGNGTRANSLLNTTPVFISPTPQCGSTINVDAGSPVSFTIAAEDDDAGDVVTLSASSLPSGSSMDPSLPASGNPVSSMFTWTPTTSDIGTHQVTYTATDNLGAAVSCTLTVQVADVPPPPSAVCPHSQGYWKNHSSKWPGSALSLMLGTVNNYNQSQLLSILNAAPRGDASIILAHQLIAAKLNVANGSPVPADVQSAITNADAAISTATIPMGIKANTTLGGYMTSLASLLDQYNNNLLSLNCVAMDKTKGDQREIVTEFALFHNYPNPFNPETKIKWQSPVAGHQTLKVYDVLGNEVATLVDEYKDAGRYETTFDASRLASGIYFYRLRAGTFVETRKMLLVR